MSTSLRPHDRQYCPDAVQCAEKIHVKGELPIGIRRFVKRLTQTKAGVIEKEMNLPGSELGRLVDHGNNAFLLGHIGLDSQYPSGVCSPKPFAFPFQFVGVQVCQNDCLRAEREE